MANPQHEFKLRDAVREGNSALDMTGFDLSGVRFPSVRLEGVSLTDANLQGADLSGGYLRGYVLRKSNLKKARITLGDLRNADLSGADLTAADLNGSTMSGAKLTNANLKKTSLVKARLDGADLTGANIDQCDLRGAQGLTEAQLLSTLNSAKVILDERMLSELRRDGDVTIARHGRPTRKRVDQNQIDLMFDSVKPSFGDVFLICGYDHPDFPPTGRHGFEELADLGFEQVDDYFAICANGDPVVWLFPLIKRRVVEHHSGPFDGVRIQLDDRSYKKLWTTCVARFKDSLRIPIVE